MRLTRMVTSHQVPQVQGAMGRQYRKDLRIVALEDPVTGYATNLLVRVWEASKLPVGATVDLVLEVKEEQEESDASAQAPQASRGGDGKDTVTPLRNVKKSEQ